MRDGIAALKDKDVKLVDLVRAMFAEEQRLLPRDGEAAQADEILTNIIIPNINSTALLANSGGRLSVQDDSEVILGGAYYKEWAKGMISYGVKGAAEPLAQWPREVRLVRTADRKIYLQDENDNIIIPGMKYIEFNLIPYMATMVVLVVSSGKSPKPLIDRFGQKSRV